MFDKKSISSTNRIWALIFLTALMSITLIYYLIQNGDHSSSSSSSTSSSSSLSISSSSSPPSLHSKLSPPSSPKLPIFLSDVTPPFNIKLSNNFDGKNIPKVTNRHAPSPFGGLEKGVASSSGDKNGGRSRRNKWETGHGTDKDRPAPYPEPEEKFKDQGLLSGGFIQTEIRHSAPPEAIEFTAWEPFANSHKSKPIDRVNCPPYPPKGYPKSYDMKLLLENWNADETEVPEFHYDSICHFDYSNETELQYAYNYRDADLPFMMYNYPVLDKVSRDWSDNEYVREKLKSKKYHTETSENNHFMYWRGGKSVASKLKWKPPTGSVSVTYDSFLKLAVKGQNVTIEDREHQYFRVSSNQGNEWLYDEVPFFGKGVRNVMMVNPAEQQGIHCRFGMRSVIAEAHFDGSRNAVAMIRGLRRWIMTHPSQCKDMYMLPPSHPSSRHSNADWSKPDYKTFPTLATVQAHEIIMQPGDWLYVPTYWIHYIISLNVNMQCNSRSGKTNLYSKDIQACGF